jgi:hypothetical protein
MIVQKNVETLSLEKLPKVSFQKDNVTTHTPQYHWHALSPDFMGS